MHDDTAAADTPRCTVCRSGMWDDELGRYACRRCQDRADDNLKALAGPKGLYAALNGALVPSQSGNGEGPVSGSKSAPIPIRLGPLSLAAEGGAVTILQTWAEDWHHLMRRNPPRWKADLQARLDQAVQTLRFNLEWAAGSHPAYDEFHGELKRIVGECRAAVSGERAERPIVLICGTPDCARTLTMYLSTEGRTCPGCHRDYTHDQLLDLKLAPRSIAA